MSGRDDTPRQVAVLGLGSMGGAMAGWLAHNGWQVRGHDPDPAAREAAESAGVGCVADPTELAGTPYVVLSLPSAAVVAEVLPLLVTADTRAVVDTTTSDPGTARGMAEVCGRHGAAFVDAPVSGGAAPERGRVAPPPSSVVRPTPSRRPNPSCRRSPAAGSAISGRPARARW